MKRISIALAALGLSAGVLAALPATTDPTLVAVPQLPGGFVIGATAFYMQPSVSNGDLDFATFNAGTSTLFFSSLKNVDPGFDWGWGINVGYIFPNTGNDINLSWFHLDTSDTAGFNIPPIFPFVNGFINPIFIGGINFPDFFFARSRAEFDLDQVDLTVGQFIDVGCRLILHPNVGLRWASLDRKIDSTFAAFSSFAITNISSTTAITTTNIFGVEEKSDFDGIGPLVGIDASYYIGWGFGAVAHFDTALLVGNIDVHTNAALLTTTTVTTTPPPVTTVTSLNLFDNFKADDTNRIVPVVDAKLGLDYTYVFNNAANSDLTLEVGWQVSNYFNAIDRLNTQFGTVVNAGNVGASLINPSFIIARTTSDFGIEGPYVNLTLHI